MMASAPAKAHIAEVGALAEHVDPVVYRVAFVGSRDRAGVISVAATFAELAFQFFAAAVMQRQARAQADLPSDTMTTCRIRFAERPGKLLRRPEIRST